MSGENLIDYLGDGVYAKSHDGISVWLLTNDHENPTDRIYLEPAVIRALNNFVERMEKAHETVH